MGQADGEGQAREAGLLSEGLLRTQTWSVCSAEGPTVTVTVAAGAGSDALMGPPERPSAWSAFLEVLRPEGHQPSLGFSTHMRGRLFLSSQKRPARERLLGFMLVSWR